MDFQFGFIFTYVATYLFCAAYSIIVLSHVTSDIGREYEVRYFRLMILSFVVYCVFESLWAVANFARFEPLNLFNLPFTMINSIMVNAFCYFWFCFVESTLHSRIIDKPRLRAFSAIPFLIVIAAIFTTGLTSWVFYMQPDGTIARGNLYIAVIIVGYGYAVVATVRAIVAAMHTKDRSQRRGLLNMAAFAIPPAIVGVVDTLVPLMPIVAPAFFLSFLFIFTMLQDSQISHDALTGLNNRRSAERYLSDALSRASRINPLFFFVIDGDLFKSVNDNYGHLEGDHALRTIANAIRDACRSTNAFAARWGGDEFVVIGFKADVGEPEDFADHIKDCLYYERRESNIPYKLSVSIGYSTCTDPKCDQHKVISEADEMLYKQKSQRRR